MKRHQRSFERLSRVLDTISDDEITEATACVRAFRTGREVGASSKELPRLLAELEIDELLWLEMVLCVRAQQAGRESAWRRFAQSSYREVVAFYR